MANANIRILSNNVVNSGINSQNVRAFSALDNRKVDDLAKVVVSNTSKHAETDQS